MNTFKSLGLQDQILTAVLDAGYSEPTPIQMGAIPSLIAGRDLLGIAQTGTGKTAAFSLPLLHRLITSRKKAEKGRPRALILAPTRELACQITDNFQSYGKLAHLRAVSIYGGAPIQGQIRRLAKGVHILVATPGRLLDLINQGCVRLDGVEFLVLDEADRMLDLGFARDLQKIITRLPSERQTALFSATMPKAVNGLAEGLLNDPVRVEIAPQATTAEKVDQQVMFVLRENKRVLLTQILRDSSIRRALIFTRTKRGADKVARQLQQDSIASDVIHGNKSQNARQRALNNFRDGKSRILVATDIAARGIDVDGISHVINFELPNEPDSYVHRIGRTARAGASGRAISFCDRDEYTYLQDIERTISQPVPVNRDHPFHIEIGNVVAGPKSKSAPQRSRHDRGHHPKNSASRKTRRAA